MAEKTFLPRKLTLVWKMAIISWIGLIGLLALGGIGFWVSADLTGTATTALEQVGKARSLYARTAEDALQSKEQARMLSELSSDLIALQKDVIEGSNRHIPGVTAEKVILHAQQLAQKAALVKAVPGADKPIPGTNGITLGDQVVGNFTDVAILLEYELPDLFAETPGTAAFKRRQGDMIISMTGMYWFISRTLGELSDGLAERVANDQTELVRASDEADRIALQANQELLDVTGHAREALLITFVITIAALATLFIRFAIGVISPLKKTVTMAEELRRGRVGARLEVGRRNDEFGDMARALNDFADNLQNEVVVALQKMAHGDLNVAVNPCDDQDEIRGALEKMASDMNSVLAQIQMSSNQISTGSLQVSDSSQSLSDGATSSASSLEQISASMSQLASQTTINADSADQANALSKQAKQFAEQGNTEMAAMVGAMGEINSASHNISKIIKVIDEIAFQTNLLALNAAVEAARAGQHGKGFAVVAEEVRNLAARSAKAARETAVLIEGAVTKAKNGSNIAQATEKALDEIVSTVTRVTDLVEEISVSSREQAEGISQVNQGLTLIDQVTQQNTASAEESAAASEELSAQAGHLRQMLARFVLRSGRPGGAEETRLLEAGWGD